MMDTLPDIFWTPAERGRLTELRVRAHASGAGEVIARHLEMTNAQTIVKAVRSHDALVDACRALVDAMERGDAGVNGVGAAHAKAKAALKLVDGARA